jgi:hypothetical protein
MMTNRDGQEDARLGRLAPRTRGIGADGFRATDASCLLAQVEGLFAVSAVELTPRDLLTAVCWTVESHLSLAGAVFWKRVGGRSLSLAWSARGVSAGRRMAARESAWTLAHALLTGGAPPAVDVRAAGASILDEPLALAAVLYVESRRPLDDLDRELLGSLLRRMVCAPRRYEG